MHIPFTDWYINVHLLKHRRFGVRNEVIEYAQFYGLYLGFFEVCLNDWSEDA